MEDLLSPLGGDLLPCLGQAVDGRALESRENGLQRVEVVQTVALTGKLWEGGRKGGREGGGLEGEEGSHNISVGMQ